MQTHDLTTDEKELRRKIRMNAIMLGLVAFGFFVVFIVITSFKG